MGLSLSDEDVLHRLLDGQVVALQWRVGIAEGAGADVA